MKGKKANPEFVSQFISECVQKNIITSETIVQAAKVCIQDIDDKIKEVELLKVRRSKLLDVITTFDKTKEDKTEEIKLLPFFELKYPDTCKKICDMLAKMPFDVLDDHFISLAEDPVFNFCLKQLFIHKIIARTGNLIVCGERYHEYMKFVLREIE